MWLATIVCGTPQEDRKLWSWQSYMVNLLGLQTEGKGRNSEAHLLCSKEESTGKNNGQAAVVKSVAMAPRQRARCRRGRRGRRNTYSEESFSRDIPYHIRLEIEEVEGQMVGLALEDQNTNQTMDPYWLIKTFRVFSDLFGENPIYKPNYLSPSSRRRLMATHMSSINN